MSKINHISQGSFHDSEIKKYDIKIEDISRRLAIEFVSKCDYEILKTMFDLSYQKEYLVYLNDIKTTYFLTNKKQD